MMLTIHDLTTLDSHTFEQPMFEPPEALAKLCEVCRLNFTAETLDSALITEVHAERVLNSTGWEIGVKAIFQHNVQWYDVFIHGASTIPMSPTK